MEAAEKLFSEADQQVIMQAIATAEKNTSGEIRLFIEDACEGNPLDRAVYVFHYLKMNKTKLRNGVLFYLAFADRKFAIIGDSGINGKVPKDFWDEIKFRMTNHFTTENFVAGLSQGITMAGAALAAHFPYAGGEDKNELSDEIVFGIKK
ncbi:MAG: hypothetical protein RIQ89_1246 [Bacteroidota bacterium]|jgi:uncharacterized membrane protein